MTIDILMPALSPTMEEGTLSKWLVKVGDKVSPGDLIAEIETDKATMEVESIHEGTVGKLLADEGTEGIKVNSIIGIILEEDENPEEIELNAIKSRESEKSSKEDFLEEDKKLLPDEEHKNQPTSNQKHIDINNPRETIKISNNNQNFIDPDNTEKDRTRIFSSPLARRIATNKGIDLLSIKGSGPYGRIIKRDVEEIDVSKNIINSDLEKDLEFSLVKNSNMRKTIAARLLKSKHDAPHFYETVDCNIEKLLTIRSDINEELSLESKISVNDFIIKAVGMSLIKIPETNVSWEEENTKFYNSANISIAVALDDGLITPIVRNVEKKGLQAIANEVKVLVHKAKEGKLTHEEYNGGTFSISNLGMYGIKSFTAVINPPQGAILAVGAGEKRPVVIDNKIEIATIMSVTLSCDHRVIDGVVGAKFLSYFKKVIENPSLMIL